MTKREKIRWGILGPGRISEKFANDLALVEDAEIAAVGSRSLDRSASFTRNHGGLAFGSYEAMVKEGGIDIMYIGTPHFLHLKQTLLCLENRFPVLCEKTRLVWLGKEVPTGWLNPLEKPHQNVFFMESRFWTSNSLPRLSSQKYLEKINWKSGLTMGGVL